jgi:hypothetical protein
MESVSLETVPVRVSAKMARLPFQGCSPDYIASTCHGRCCWSTGPDGRSTAHVYAEPDQRPAIAACGGSFSPTGILQATPAGRCAFHGPTGFCGLHAVTGTSGESAKPRSCFISPWMLTARGTLIIRNRYRLLGCYKAAPALPAYVAFRSGLDMLFGQAEAQRIHDHLAAGGGDLTAAMLSARAALVRHVLEEWRALRSSTSSSSSSASTPMSTPASTPAPKPTKQAQPAAAKPRARERTPKIDGLAFTGPTGGDPTFYPAKARMEKVLGRTLTSAEFIRDYYQGSSSRLQSGTSIFDPVLAELLIRWFSPPGGLIVDPFAGGSVRGLVAAVLGRRYAGTDLSASQITANQRQAEYLLRGSGPFRSQPSPSWHLSDASDAWQLGDPFSTGSADFLLACPPYFDTEQYSDDARDLSNMSWPDFARTYRNIVDQFCSFLKPDRFAAFVVGDTRDKDGHLRGLPQLTVEAFRLAGFALYNDAILVTPVGTVAVRCQRFFTGTRKLGRTHQKVLVFVKGSAKRATEAIGPVEFGAVDQFVERDAAASEDPDAEAFTAGAAGAELLSSPLG